MKYSFIHEIFYYTEFYVLFFALYQFTGVNSYIDASAANLAASAIVLLCYLVWLVWITYLGVKYRDRLDQIPQKYKFLVY
jgi:Ca2+/Na+ antiporter